MISVVIPTLQKRLDILEKLVMTLNKDTSVGEIIIINNNPEKSIEFDFDKLKVITPNKNVYVNPAWNMGVDFAENDIVGLLNDDIIIADDFCSNLVSALPDNFGVIGYTAESIVPIENVENTPEKVKIELKKQDIIDFGFGIAMFFKKGNYPIIPSEIKIMYGDCWIFNKIKEKGLDNYVITGQKIHHFGSLSTSNKSLSPIIKNDKKIYQKLTMKWYEKFFSIQEYADCVKMRILGANIRLYNKKR